MLYRVAIYHFGEPSYFDDDDSDFEFEEQHDHFIPEPGDCAREIPVFLVNRFLIAQPLDTEGLDKSDTLRIVAAEAMRRAFINVHLKLVELNAPEIIINHFSNLEHIAECFGRVRVPFALRSFPALWQGVIDHDTMGFYQAVVETSLNSDSVDA